MNTENLSEKTILGYIALAGIASVPQLVKWYGTSATTALGIIRRLAAKGLIARRSQGGRGRRVVTYGLQLAKPLVVCQFDGTAAFGVLVQRDLTQGPVQTREVCGIRRKEQAVTLTKELCDAVLAEAGVGLEEVGGVALSVNATDMGGSSMISSVLPWVDDTLEESFSAGLGIRARTTRVPIGVVAEYRQRLVKECRPPASVVDFQVADGVSAHTMVQGRPLCGQSSLAGELGHVTYDVNGPLCGCGRKGCLEAYCSGPAIWQQVVEGLDAGVVSRLASLQFAAMSPRKGIECLWQAWQDGDTYARAIMDPVFDRLGWGLALVINLLDPELVSVGGYVMDAKPAWLEEMSRRAQRWILHAAGRSNRIEFRLSRLEDEIGVAVCDFYYPLGSPTTER